MVYRGTFFSQHKGKPQDGEWDKSPSFLMPKIYHSLRDSLSRSHGGRNTDMKDTNSKTCNMTLSKKPRKYEINGKTFMVKPVFKEKFNESAASILLKLLKSESGGHHSQSH